MRIDAKPTKSQGTQFRSKLEAQWAEYLTGLGYRWEYEKRTFDTTLGWYLPDFWLPELSMWAEVKPGRLDKTALTKIMDVSSQTGNNALLFEGSPRKRVWMVERHGDMQALQHYKGLIISNFSLGGSFDAEQSL